MESGPVRLSIRGVSRAFGATKALVSVDFEAHAGEVHALIGENGAGKSTLMKVLAGALTPDAGTLALDGASYHPRSPAEARSAGVAIVSQELALCPHMTVAENIVLGREPTRLGLLDRNEIGRVAGAALSEIGRPDLALDARVADLPIAERQLVEIARALASNCKLLILDEPTSSLGRGDVERLFDRVRALRGRGTTVLYISHFLEEVRSIADRFTVLRDGATTASGRVSDVSDAEIVQAMAGRAVENLFTRGPRAPGETVLTLHELAGASKPSAASLELRRGEVLGIAGLIGAGRTEMLRAIFGLDPVKRGTVRVKRWSGPARPRARLAQGVGFLSEDRKTEGLALSMSIADNVTLSRLDGLGPWRFVSQARQRSAVARWMTELGIKARDSSQPVGDLSGGNQQKVALSRLLHQDADVFLLDEPTRGIDVASKAQIYALIDRLAAEGKAILLVSSYLPELLGVCDRIAVMCRGRLGDAKAVGEWTSHTLLEEAIGIAGGSQAREDAAEAPP
ncbi:MAG: sugar ABC transporter ATP-binding protein [Polyangiaceae bacterium]